MGHRRIKKPRPTLAEAKLMVHKILFPDEYADVPAKFQPVLKRLETLCREGAETVDLQYAALYSCAQMFERLRDRTFEYRGPSSPLIVAIFQEIESLQKAVGIVLQMAQAYNRLGEEDAKHSSIENIQAIEKYHDIVYGAMFETLSQCRDWLQYVTEKTPQMKEHPEHPFWEIKRQVEEATARGAVKSADMKQVLREELSPGTEPS